MDLKGLDKKLTKFEESAAQVAVLAITFILYLLTKNAIFGALVAVEFIAFVLLEVQQGVKKHGVKNEIIDTLKSFGIAILAWLAISFLLRTTVPVSAVVSCSMLPSLQRGDLTIIHGTTAAELAAPEINVSWEELQKIYSTSANIYSEYGNFSVDGSLFSYCQTYQFTNPTCKYFFSEPEKFTEARGGLEFRYSNCERRLLDGGGSSKTPCITSVSYGGTEYAANASNSIIVYEPNKGDLFSYTGDIIHRVFLKVKSGNDSYVLTKGDNNNIFDIQFYDYSRKLANRPVPEKNIKGEHMFAIPYIGYFKLFISGFVEEPVYCNTNLEH